MALLSEEEKQQLKQIMVDYPNNEDLDLTAYIADVIGITGKHQNLEIIPFINEVI